MIFFLSRRILKKKKYLPYKNLYQVFHFWKIEGWHCGSLGEGKAAAPHWLVSAVRDASPVTQRGRDLSLSSGGASEGRCFSEACLVEHPNTIGRPPAEIPRFGAEGDGPWVVAGWGLGVWIEPALLRCPAPGGYGSAALFATRPRQEPGGTSSLLMSGGLVWVAPQKVTFPNPSLPSPAYRLFPQDPEDQKKGQSNSASDPFGAIPCPPACLRKEESPSAVWKLAAS
jgi:hypothetical protein